MVEISDLRTDDLLDAIEARLANCANAPKGNRESKKLFCLHRAAGTFTIEG